MLRIGAVVLRRRDSDFQVLGTEQGRNYVFWTFDKSNDEELKIIRGCRGVVGLVGNWLHADFLGTFLELFLVFLSPFWGSCLTSLKKRLPRGGWAWLAIGSMLIWNPSSIFRLTASTREDEIYSRNRVCLFNKRVHSSVFQLLKV